MERPDRGFAARYPDDLKFDARCHDQDTRVAERGHGPDPSAADGSPADPEVSGVGDHHPFSSGAQ